MKRKRVWKNRVLMGLVCLAGVAVVVLGGATLLYTLLRGFANLNMDMFTGSTSLLFVHISLLPALINTLVLVVASTAVSMVLGNLIATAVSGMKRTGRARSFFLFILEAAAAVPPLVYGLLGQAVFCTLLGMGLSLWAGVCTMSLMLVAEISYSGTLAQLHLRDRKYEQTLALGARRSYLTTNISSRENMALVLNGFFETAARACSEGVILLLTMGVGTQLAGNVVQLGRQSGATLTSMLYVYVSARGNYTVGFASAALLLMLVWLLLTAGRTLQKGGRGGN